MRKNGSPHPVIKLYKYLKPEHVEGAITKGIFRVGTLHEYRDAERYPGAQFDGGEGKMVIGGVIHGYSSEAGHRPPPLIERIFGRVGPGSKITINRTIIEEFHDRTPNLYVFCAAHRFNLDIYNRPEYGAAVLITDAYAFCMALTKKLIALGKVPAHPVASGPIEYRDRQTRFAYYNGELHTDARVPWCYVKPDCYSAEHEWRFAWDILSREENLIISCPEAVRYCKLYDPTIRRRRRKTSRLRSRRTGRS